MSTPIDEKRLEQFRSDVADLKVKGGATRGPGTWRVIGGLLMVVGIVVTFVVYLSSLSQSDPRNIQSAIILALVFVGITVLGAALYIAASIASSLRLWLLRQLYEGQAHADQITEALRGRVG